MITKDERFSFYLSNSMLRDWEKMCPIEFNQKWFKENPAYIFGSEAMEMGSVFETLVIGMSVGGKATPPTDKLKKSVFYQRILEQAEDAKRFLKLMGGKKLAVQEYLKAIVVDSEGQEVPICGNLDIRYGWIEEAGRMAVIDLKFTGDVENEFGEFKWGRVDQMDCSQAIHYSLLCRINYPASGTPEFYYHVYDNSAYMKKAHIRVKISDYTFDQHIERCSKAYFEILDSLMFNSWKPIQEYKHCSKCKCKCTYEKLMPEIIEIEK